VACTKFDYAAAMAPGYKDAEAAATCAYA